jgi:hypothetical protein
MQQAMYRPSNTITVNYCCCCKLQTFYFQNILKVALTIKALEISNATGNTINLSLYSVKKQNQRTGAWSSGIVLSGTLSTGKKIHNS